MTVDHLAPVSDDFVGMVEERAQQKNWENDDENLNGVIAGGILLVHMETGVEFTDDRSDAATSE